MLSFSQKIFITLRSRVQIPVSLQSLSTQVERLCSFEAVSKARFRKQTKSKKAKRAPKWMHGAGLEWLFRLIQEPKRMYRRYLIEAPLFIPLVILDRIKKFK
jgi:hypothetical protein